MIDKPEDQADLLFAIGGKYVDEARFVPTATAFARDVP
jgi:hypothetical protein